MFNQKLHEAIKNKCGTQTAFVTEMNAQGCDVTKQSVSAWVRGNRTPNTAHRHYAAQVLDTNADELFANRKTQQSSN